MVSVNPGRGWRVGAAGVSGARHGAGLSGDPYWQAGAWDVANPGAAGPRNGRIEVLGAY